jgi:hypothetical protein
VAWLCEPDARKAWQPCGARSAAIWVAVRTRISKGKAGAELRLARTLGRLATTEIALRTGEITIEAAGLIARCATSRTGAAFDDQAEAFLLGEAHRHRHRYRDFRRSAATAPGATKPRPLVSLGTFTRPVLAPGPAQFTDGSRGTRERAARSPGWRARTRRQRAAPSSWNGSSGSASTTNQPPRSSSWSSWPAPQPEYPA